MTAREGIVRAKTGAELVTMPLRSPLEVYHAACEALSRASEINTVLPLIDEIEHVKLYARQVRDRKLLADAYVFQLKAERKLGEILIAAKDAGHFTSGHRTLKSSDHELLPRATLAEVGVDKKLSSRAQKLAAIPQPQFQKNLDDVREQVVADGATAINGARAVMASRQQPDDDLDFSPTPPWATRALMERVLPQVDFAIASQSCWEPACGEGHMAEVLAEYFGRVYASDCHGYGYGTPDADFLADLASPFTTGSDWIITNPPFGDLAERFALRALERAKVGVAIFAQLRWLETVGRYERLFRDHPPTLLAIFAERVNLCMGRWEPDGTTATAYMWLVWIKNRKSQAPFWIPPSCREELTRSDDRERFTAHPVAKRSQAITESVAATAGAAAPEPACGGPGSLPPRAGSPDDSLDVPSFVNRKNLDHESGGIPVRSPALGNAQR